MNTEKPGTVLHWNYRGFTKFPIERLNGEESDVTDIYLKENLISRVPNDIGKLRNLESLYLSGNDIEELPAEISGLERLKCLDLSGNRLRRIPDEIGEMRGLKFLILDENELRTLPTRIAEIRTLRYLSVCDNKLQWLPQRPIYNYYHCEFKFWRNTDLKTIPYSLWYHMFRDQQTRSLNIGCLNVSSNINLTQTTRCRLSINQDSRYWEIDVNCPPQYINIISPRTQTPPTLFELTKRVVYQMVSTTANMLNTVSNKHDCYKYTDNEVNNNINVLGDVLNSFRIGEKINSYCEINTSDPNSLCLWNKERHKQKDYYVPSDVIDKFLYFLPNFLKTELANGPTSNCENVYCRKAIFDFVHYEFCLEKIILIENIEDIILSATFCSKACSDYWKLGKLNIIPWTQIK